ncbi:unnamed protein product [Penicillium olsonii]|uniref:DUF4396 domain-containing protein n=1 Tax=Penicillium olsonii TaxID=99116 RepID=A0A9W4HMU8_PENOL|nr:unnamed protein product [Penicillium olsonii]CAG8093540.1 unnamed protein product [Penicillium olsonii]
MNFIRHPVPLRQSHLFSRVATRPFRSATQLQACHSEKTRQAEGSKEKLQTCQSKNAATSPSQPLSTLSLQFWNCKSTWRRAGVNTLRCLVGCTAGDFSALWILQTYYPELGMGTIMAMSMASGITTSIILETVLLRRGADQLSWSRAARTAMGMSMVSMLAMELAENAVDYHLTGGMVAFDDPKFWLAAVVSMGAGYLAPLPYNYLRLRKYGKACH